MKAITISMPPNSSVSTNENLALLKEVDLYLRIEHVGENQVSEFLMKME